MAAGLQASHRPRSCFLPLLPLNNFLPLHFRFSSTPTWQAHPLAGRCPSKVACCRARTTSSC